MTTTLTRRQLNRALLARQMFLHREDCTPLEAVQRLFGLQAQLPNPPYIGLWVRLQNIQRDDLTHLMETRQVVRAALMRSTLHLMTAEDYLRFRMTLQPALDRALNAFFGKRARDLDLPAVVAAAQSFVSEAPRSTGEVKARMLELMPGQDGEALAYAVRNNIPQVQVPPGGVWGSGSAGAYIASGAWIGEVDPNDNAREMFRRYLMAFGPASVMDFQAWSGLTKLKDVLESMRAELRVYRSESGKELFDVPEATLPPEDTPVPVCFVPEYDNLIISHADRSHIIADEDRPKVFLSAARVLGTILVDGFVAGTWKTEIKKKSITLRITPFDALAAEDETALAEEGERLARFILPDAATLDVTFSAGNP
ncbi:MAG: winged helix DNA-binding domain-containing protein [Anaerolineae bacterium]